MFDACSYVNGDIYKCKVEAKDVIDDMVEIHRKRWFKYIRKVVLDFQDFIHFVFFNVGPLISRF